MHQLYDQARALMMVGAAALLKIEESARHGLLSSADANDSARKVLQDTTIKLTDVLQRLPYSQTQHQIGAIWTQATQAPLEEEPSVRR